jgi:Fur family transcriptional regulator, ferric uptake regulator
MIRNTRQQQAIREAFLNSDRPLSPQEVLGDAKDRASGLGLATVYRHIKGLIAEGWLIAVELPGEPARYELSGKRHHHHFHCRACGRVFDIPGCPGRIGATAPRGFQIDDHEIVLYGRCPECAAA